MPSAYFIDLYVLGRASTPVVLAECLRQALDAMKDETRGDVVDPKPHAVFCTPRMKTMGVETVRSVSGVLELSGGARAATVQKRMMGTVRATLSKSADVAAIAAVIWEFGSGNDVAVSLTAGNPPKTLTQDLSVQDLTKRLRARYTRPTLDFNRFSEDGLVSDEALAALLEKPRRVS